jgi:hypothetical protein
MTRRQLFGLACLSGLPWIAWFIGVSAMAWLLWNRAPEKPAPPAAADPVASRDLPANHVLTAGDLRLDATTALQDHALLNAAKSGTAVKATMVSKAKVPRSHTNTLAAVVYVPAALRAGAGIDVGSFVSIFRGATLFGPPGRVIAVACDDVDCTITVALPRTERMIDPDALDGATLEPVVAPIAPPAAPTPPASMPPKFGVIMPVIPFAQVDVLCQHGGDAVASCVPLCRGHVGGVCCDGNRPASAPKNVCSTR